MLEESGHIVDVEGEFAWVESERQSTCGGCSARKGCGTGAIAKVLGRKRMRLRVVNRIDAAVGDHVVIGIAESGVVRGSLAVYAVPLAGLFGGAIAGQLAGGYLAGTATDLPAMAGATAGFVAGLAWLGRFSRATRTDESYQPVLLRRETRLPTV
ncbi:MAG: SoxR reducing system RseC family protein [Halobacteria archaeon]|nr:SoxR reducing system RseC family protein [Halobacteria archaeon]